METLPEFILAPLRQLAHDRPPPRTLLAVLRELAQEYKAFLSGDPAKRDELAIKKVRQGGIAGKEKVPQPGLVPRITNARTESHC